MTRPDPKLTQTIDLIHRAGGGDAAAFGRLLEKYAPQVRARIRRKLGERMRRLLDSTDVMQETLVEAVRDFEKIEVRSERELVNLLFKIAENRIHGLADHHFAQKRDPGALAQLMSSLVAGAGPGPATQLAAHEEQARLRACFEQLPEHYREVLKLRFQDGMSWKEIATRIGSPSEGAARETHVRALLRLRKLLRPE